MAKSISSLQNPLVKQIRLLQEKSRERRKRGLFVVEGEREISLALNSGYTLDQLLYCLEIDPTLTDRVKYRIEKEPINISEKVYGHLAYRGSTEGLIAVFEGRAPHVKDLLLQKDNPLILVAEATEKPGNIGALLRTADAAGVDAVIIANPLTDLFHPNIIRSSVGGVFTNTVATGTSADVIAFLEQHDIAIYTAALQASVSYLDVDMKGATAIVVGTEASGLTEEWIEHSSANIRIPMRGKLDSMNVSVAAGILIFEACRQRG